MPARGSVNPNKNRSRDLAISLSQVRKDQLLHLESRCIPEKRLSP